MAAPSDLALAIHRALAAARARGEAPIAIVMGEPTRWQLEAAGLGLWAGGRACWSLFGVPVEVEADAAGWRVRTRRRSD